MISRIQAVIEKPSLPKIIGQHPVAFSIIVASHCVLLIGLLFSDIQNIQQTSPTQLKKNTSRTIPKAVIVDLSEITKEKQLLVDNQKNQQSELKRKQRQLRELEDQRYQKQRQINRLNATTKKQQQARILAEKKTKIAQQKTKEAEKQHKAEVKKFKEEQKKRELVKVAELKATQKIKAERQRILDELKVNYTAQIRSRVHSQWRYSGAKDDWNCVVDIVQDKDGNVQTVTLDTCNVDNNNKKTSFKNSIIRAVNRASPLPSPPDASIFDPEINFIFKINE